MDILRTRYWTSYNNNYVFLSVEDVDVVEFVSFVIYTICHIVYGICIIIRFVEGVYAQGFKDSRERREKRRCFLKCEDTASFSVLETYDS